MFDPATAQFLQSAPGLPNLDPASLPERLTRHYALLALRRLRHSEAYDQGKRKQKYEEWPLSKIADVYEIIASIENKPEIRRPSAFVAATAQQILAREIKTSEPDSLSPSIDRDHIDPAITAAILFLLAEQFADAQEASIAIKPKAGDPEYAATILAEHIQDLASGKLKNIIDRSSRRGIFKKFGMLEEQATTMLFETLVVGIELMAAEMLLEAAPESVFKKFENAREAFLKVLELSSETSKIDTFSKFNAELIITYSAPRHLAALLLSVYDNISGSAVTKITPPPDADNDFWNSWTKHRANLAPFIWPNHMNAIADGFYYSGRSAVLILPTGAGKTTISALKVAAAIAQGKNVIFLAPTHALVDQMTEDLQEIFPEELLGSVVSSDFDSLFSEESQLKKIEVMTPERCLALLSFAPEAFANVGLMVFDECHLLSPEAGSLRRSLDGMFCVLAFNNAVPDADFLFLSAMLVNGEQFSQWIGALTEKNCTYVESLWKPSRQARGVILYAEDELHAITAQANKIQGNLDSSAKKTAKGVRKGANEVLQTTPYALFGLQHNWLGEKSAICSFLRLSKGKVKLEGGMGNSGIYTKPSVNSVASHIASLASQSGLKTIVFVNTKKLAVSTAKLISEQLGDPFAPSESEQARWDSLALELGGLKHSLLPGPANAVPHNAQMLRLERDLAERMFRRHDGAQVIVATPTLAQGLNLPAQVAILAGDMRADGKNREALKTHEILNAAGRAGRAGHLANGVVFLVPEKILRFSKKRPRLDKNIIDRLKSVLPEDDRCLSIVDPLQTILDRISASSFDDLDVEYTLNRLSTLAASEENKNPFSIPKSFAAFVAREKNTKEDFEKQVRELNAALTEKNAEIEDTSLLDLAARSGAPIPALQDLSNRLAENTERQLLSITDWANWIFEWLCEDENALRALLGRDKNYILGAAGKPRIQSFLPRSCSL